MKYYFVLLTLLLFLIVKSSYENAIVQIDLQSYYYPQKKSEINEKKCDSHWWVDYECSPIFYFCLKEELTRSCSKEAIKVGPYSKKNSITFSKPFVLNDIPNPLIFEISKFTAQIKLNVSVWQVGDKIQISQSEQPLYMDINSPYIPGRDEATAQSVKRNIKGPKNIMKLSISFKIWCSEHFYGDECTKYCANENSSNGHYNCSVDGDKMCLPGWSDPETNCTIKMTACDLLSPCDNNSTCLSLNDQDEYLCNCTVGFWGKNCSLEMSTSDQPSTSHLTTSLPEAESSVTLTTHSELTTQSETTLSTSLEFTNTKRTSTFILSTMGTFIIPKGPLMVKGKLDDHAQTQLIAKLKTILSNELQISVTNLKMTQEFKFAESTSGGFAVTVIYLKVNPIPQKDLNYYLFKNGITWLSRQLSQTVYIGGLKTETDYSKTSPDAIKRSVWVVCSVVLFLVLVIVAVFIYKTFEKKQRMRRARHLSSRYGVQLSRRDDGFTVNIQEDDHVEVINPMSEDPIYQSPSEYYEDPNSLSYPPTVSMNIKTSTQNHS